jgi:hypothetical protein
MKEFTVDFKNAIAQSVTTICQCVKILRSDGVKYTLTNFDSDLTIDGELYRSSYAFNPTAYSTALGLQIENMEIEGAVDDLFIDDFDIIKNKFYGAEVWFFSVDYKNIDYGKNKILYGTVGEIEVTDKQFKMEVRGISKRYEDLYTSYYGKMCRARLGDSRCGVNLDVPEYKVIGSVYNEDISSGSITAKYLRMTIHSSGWINKLQIFEIKILDRLDNNLCASSILSLTNLEETVSCNDGQSRPLSNLIDEDVATYTCLGPYENNYKTTTLQFEFDKPVNISSIVIIDSNGTPKCDGITLKSSIDAYTWTTNFSNASLTSFRSGNTVNFNFYVLLSDQKVKKYKFISNEVSNFEDNYFQYGYVKWLTGLNAGVQTEVIQSLKDGSIELAIPMPYNIHTDDTFEIYVGCNHLLIGADGTPFSGHCYTRFDNTINFRGEPYLPNEDIMLSGFVAVMNDRETEESSTSAVLEPV